MRSVGWLLVATATAVALATTACGGEPAAEAEPPVRRAAEYRSERLEVALEAASEVVRARGFHDDEGAALRGFLVDRGSATDAESLRSGNCYVIVAVASSAVRSLEVALYDSDGAAVARSGLTPALHYCPPTSGTYFVAARATGSGLFALRVFEGPTGIDVRLDDLPLGQERPFVEPAP